MKPFYLEVYFYPKKVRPKLPCPWAVPVAYYKNEKNGRKLYDVY